MLAHSQIIGMLAPPPPPPPPPPPNYWDACPPPPPPPLLPTPMVPYVYFCSSILFLTPRDQLSDRIKPIRDKYWTKSCLCYVNLPLLLNNPVYSLSQRLERHNCFFDPISMSSICQQMPILYKTGSPSFSLVKTHALYIMNTDNFDRTITSAECNSSISANTT